MEARSGVRSSARLSAEAARGAPAAAAGSGPERPAAQLAARLAAERRARAAERAREVEDSPRVFREKCRVLARALRNAKHLVVYTGAGISTAADIPDYRGPRGVWTRLQRGEAVGRVDVSRATPTLTHMALSALYARGLLKFVVSQNCDGLHLRSGLPRRALAELHGDMFVETCPACRAVYLRAFDTTERTARHAHGTRRLCHRCSHELRDSIVHFGERGRAAWPLNWAGALRHAAAADVILCLGSSLKVLRRYPRLWSMQRPPAARPALYIVNLQWTPKDSVAALKINARCDAVMAEVARRLRVVVPPYRAAADPLHAHATPLHAAELHTTRRTPLAPADSDDDDDLPLRALAERLHPPPPPAPPPPPPPRPPPPPPPPALRSFRVSLAGTEATILLRPEHAPSDAPPGVSDLRRFRFAKRPAPPLTNGHGPPTLNGRHSPEPPGVKVKREEADVKVKKEELEVKGEELDMNGEEPEVNGEELDAKGEDLDVKGEELDVKGDDLDVKGEELDVKGDDLDVKGEELDVKAPRQESAEAWAAAIFARAVLACRGSLYPGLHSMLAPPPPRCDWCWRVRGERRCLWWPPRAAARRRCACCAGPPPPSALPPAAAGDDSGWYGKGYRKGRRRR